MRDITHFLDKNNLTFYKDFTKDRIFLLEHCLHASTFLHLCPGGTRGLPQGYWGGTTGGTRGGTKGVPRGYHGMSQGIPPPPPAKKIYIYLKK